MILHKFLIYLAIGGMFMRKNNSLQIKAILSISIIFIILMSFVTAISYTNSKKLILSSLEDSGRQTITVHSQNLSSWVKSRLSQVEVIANTEVVNSMDKNKILSYFKREKDNYNGVFNSLGISDTQGKLTIQNNTVIDISSENTFPEVIGGKEIISNPFQAKEDPSQWIISMECPIKDINTNKVKGLVSGACLVSTVFKENTSFHLGKTDNVYILKKDGTVLFHKNKNLINNSNFFKNANKDYVSLLKKGTNKENFYGEFKDNAGTKKLFSSHINGTDWYMFLEVPTKEYVSSVNSLLYITTIITIFAIIVLILILIIILKYFFNRLLKVSLAAEKVAKGDLTNYLPESEDELGKFNATFNRMTKELKQIILKLKGAAEIINKSSQNYEDVSLTVVEGGESIQEGIKNLSLGAKVTSEEISNITTYVSDMEKQSKELVDISINIDDMIKETKDSTKIGSENLKKTIDVLNNMKKSILISSDAITKLSERSKNIANITTSISDISEQTNLLALNASIEAVRAGENGKGFSVVAEEVRKLAEQSSNSSSEISSEILQVQGHITEAVKTMKQSIDFMQQGTSSMDSISMIFYEIEQQVEKVKDVSSNVSEIAKILLNQNENIYQAISNTSAVSEEAAANTASVEETINNQGKVFLKLKTASEELHNISINLKEEISKFKC